MIEQIEQIKLEPIVCDDNYCYYVALLLILHKTVLPAIRKGQRMAPALDCLAIDLAGRDLELSRLITELQAKAELYHGDADGSWLKAQSLKDFWARVHRRIFELIQADTDWRIQ